MRDRGQQSGGRRRSYIDVLFLIPVPWIAQVWFPLFVSSMTIVVIAWSCRGNNSLAHLNTVKTLPLFRSFRPHSLLCIPSRSPSYIHLALDCLLR
jgi:hypothetical protein